jgi:hypothetical protein
MKKGSYGKTEYRVSTNIIQVFLYERMERAMEVIVPLKISKS